jgi:hypothetical protein
VCETQLLSFAHCFSFLRTILILPSLHEIITRYNGNEFFSRFNNGLTRRHVFIRERGYVVLCDTVVWLKNTSHLPCSNNGGFFSLLLFIYLFIFFFWRVLHSMRFFTTFIMGNVARRDYVSPPTPPIVFEIWKRNTPAAFVQIIWVRNRRLTAYVIRCSSIFYLSVFTNKLVYLYIFFVWY